MRLKATPQQTRTHNSQLVFRTIYESGQISRANVSRATGLTRPTVSDVVAELMEQGLVEEVGIGPSTGGKPPVLLSVVADSRCLIGLDLAREDFDGALINLRGEIKHRIDLPLHGRDGDKALGLVYELVDDLIESADSPLLGIGIGTPGLVDADAGVVRQAINLDWRDLPLRSLLQERYKLPVHLANDCQVAALAEHAFGSDGDSKCLVVINVGWGVGAGIVVGGQLFHGNPFGAGEIGHVTVASDGERCRCGNVGCLETIASQRAVLRRARAAADAGPGTTLHRLATEHGSMTLDVIRQAIEAGDAAARQVIRETGQALGIAAANLVGVLGSCRILISGQISIFGDFMLDTIREEMAQRSLPSLTEETDVGYVSLGSDIVLLGASALLLPRELGLSRA
jgi:predicted NBD/HSP70 family sugar kinase